MSNLEIEHKGYKVSFNEYTDAWSCPDLQIEGKPNLTAVKRLIDQWDLSSRKLKGSPVIAIKFGYSDEPTMTSAVTIADDGKVWCKGERGREKVSANDLAMDTPENREAIKRAAKLRRDSNKLTKDANQIISAIPRLTLADLRANSVEKEELKP